MNVLVDAVRGVLNSVRSDGRVPRDAVAQLRAALSEQRRHAAEPTPYEIVDGLPALEALPEPARRALYDAVRDDDEWSMWLRRATWRQSLTRALRAAAKKVPPRSLWLRRSFDLAQSVFVLWQARLAHEAYRGTLAWRGWSSATPPLSAALRIAGLDARVIASSYLRDIPQPLDTAAYWHDPARHSTVGVVVGIDFVVNDEGVWFVESNLNPGLFEDRSRLYDPDPFVTNLVRFARAHEYSSILFLSCNDYPADSIMATRLEQEAQAHGMRATVLEDRYAPQERLGQTFLLPSLTDRTLIVRSKMYHTALDAIFHHKTLSLHALESYQRQVPDRDVRLPLTGAEVNPDPASMSRAFPNLVYKFPERDQGQGVVFLKVPSLARAREILTDTTKMNRHSVADAFFKMRYRLKLEEQAGVFQAYIPSSLLEGRRLAIARAHVLATPVGIEFLSAHRVVSNLPVPESLDEGLVADAKPYIVNYSLDSDQVRMPADEELRVKKASISVVRALCRAVESRFQTGPQGRVDARPSSESAKTLTTTAP